MMGDISKECIIKLINARQCMLVTDPLTHEDTIRGVIYQRIFLDDAFDSFEEGAMLKYDLEIL
jgi:hypothetical protein